MQTCGRLVARMREQDVDRDRGAGVEPDGGKLSMSFRLFDCSRIRATSDPIYHCSLWMKAVIKLALLSKNGPAMHKKGTCDNH